MIISDSITGETWECGGYQALSCLALLCKELARSRTEFSPCDAKLMRGRNCRILPGVFARLPPRNNL